MTKEYITAVKQLRSAGYKPKYFIHGGLMSQIMMAISSLAFTMILLSVFPLGVFLIAFIWLGAFTQSMFPSVIEFQNKKQHVNIKVQGKEKLICRIAGLSYLATGIYIALLAYHLHMAFNSLD